MPTQTVQAGPRPRTGSQSGCTSQKEKSKTTDRAEAAGAHTRNDRREFPPPSHQDSGCRTAQAPRVEENYTRRLPRDHMGSPTPTCIGLVPARRVFFSKCRRPGQAKRPVKISKNTPGRPKGRRKQKLGICDHMAQRVSKTPPKTTRHQQGTLLGLENKQPF